VISRPYGQASAFSETFRNSLADVTYENPQKNATQLLELIALMHGALTTSKRFD
jgi:hypothetical protein